MNQAAHAVPYARWWIDPMSYPHPPTDGAQTAVLLGGGHDSIERFHQLYRHLTETLTYVPALTASNACSKNKPQTRHSVGTSDVVAAVREFTTAAQPLIDHLPAIIAALGDATDYRSDDGGWCTGCSEQPEGADAPTTPATWRCHRVRHRPPPP